MCKAMCKGSTCGPACVAKWLMFVGALNWGLVGVGQFFGGSDWNIVHMIFGSVSWLESVIYILVGVSAVVYIVGCKCSSCKGGVCASGVSGGCQEKEGGCCGGGNCGNENPTEQKPM